jgi:hypothetical protein
MIYLFVDSHTAVFVIDNNNQYMTPEEKIIQKFVFNSFRTLPYTCYNINDKRKIIFDFLNNLHITNNDIVFFSYGETDIRCHIGFHSKNEIEQDILIEQIVNNYMNFLIDIKNNYNFKIGCYGPIASGIHNGPNGNSGIPSYSNSIKRNEITIKFNNKLKELCNKNDIFYKDIFQHLINGNLETKNELYCDNIHLGCQIQSLLLKEFDDIIKIYAN